MHTFSLIHYKQLRSTKHGKNEYRFFFFFSRPEQLMTFFLCTINRRTCLKNDAKILAISAELICAHRSGSQRSQPEKCYDESRIIKTDNCPSYAFAFRMCASIVNMIVIRDERILTNKHSDYRIHAINKQA